jgi:heme-degrading monooxygenase HmoA
MEPAMPDFSSRPLFHINIFTPRLGRLDDFIHAQIDGVARLGDIPGLGESRLFCSEDGSHAIIMARFESVEAHGEFQNSAAFQQQRARLRPLVEATQARFYRLVNQRENRSPSGPAGPTGRVVIIDHEK